MEGSMSTPPLFITTLDAPLRAGLEALFHDLDREIAALGVGCWQHGSCCDFERSGLRLFACELEIAYVREKHPTPFPPGSRLCPFWREGKCTERERRPLGCRTHFCDRRYRESLEGLHERYLARIACLAQREGLPRGYRPFVEALRGDAGAPPP
jgi:hypothetical protein